MTLIAEDLLWLLLDDDTGRPLVDSHRLRCVLACAVVVELTQHRSLLTKPVVRITGHNEYLRDSRLVVAHNPTEWPGDSVISTAVERLGREPVATTQAIQKLRRGLCPALLDRLCAHGRIERQSSRILGLVQMSHWPTIDPQRKQALRLPLRRALLDCTPAEARTCTLISLLSVVGALPYQCPGWDRRTIDDRGGIIAENYWAADALRYVFNDIYAAAYASGIGMPIPSIR